MGCWRVLHGWILGGVILALAGCAGGSYVTVPPQMRAEPVPGTRLVYVGAGGYEWVHELVAQTGGYQTWVTKDGWRWTFRDPFSPMIGWQGPNEQGRQTVLGDMTALFPLRVGNDHAITYSGSKVGNPEETWRLYRRCRVVSQGRTSVPAGDFDAFRIECEDGVAPDNPTQRRVFYYAPALQTVIASRVERQDAPAEEWQLLRMEIPVEQRDK